MVILIFTAIIIHINIKILNVPCQHSFSAHYYYSFYAMVITKNNFDIQTSMVLKKYLLQVLNMLSMPLMLIPVGSKKRFGFLIKDKSGSCT